MIINDFQDHDRRHALHVDSPVILAWKRIVMDRKDEPLAEARFIPAQEQVDQCVGIATLELPHDRRRAFYTAEMAKWQVTRPTPANGGCVLICGLDIFCGAGGSSAGARAAGVEIVAGIDMCSAATGTFAANFPEALAITGRLESLCLNSLRRKTGAIDILLASPECTNHTCAKGAAPRDEASRATAMLVVEYARALEPQWLVLENVVHMRPWSRYGELKLHLQEIGYRLREHVLDSSDFGVAQRRRRLFLVGDRERQPVQAIRKRPGRRRSARSVLDPEGTWKTSRLFDARRAAATLERAERGFRSLGEEASFLLVYYGSDGAGGWQCLDRPLRTVTTLDRFALIRHDGCEPRMRMLQVPELKRAMGFEESFKLPVGTRRDRIRLLGNGVCPPVMEAVINSLVT